MVRDDRCPLCRQPLPGKLKGLRHDATPATVGLAQALIDRDHDRRVEGGQFHGLGHEYGRRYEDRIAPDGRLTRFWGDGEVADLE